MFYNAFGVAGFPQVGDERCRVESAVGGVYGQQFDCGTTEWGWAVAEFYKER